MLKTGFALLGLLVLLVGTAQAVDHSLQVLDEPAPADALAVEIAQTLDSKAVRVQRGASRTVCDVWFCKEWPVAAAAKPQGDVIYPFQPGQLIGVVRFPRKSSDFRDQDIAEGVYTLRYGQQPVDGAHVGTSPIRDFLLLLRASDDKAVAAIDYKQLTKTSAQAAGSNHPLLLSLQRIEGPPPKSPTIRHNEEKDWWIVEMAGKVKQAADSQVQKIELVVVGKAAD